MNAWAELIAGAQHHHWIVSGVQAAACGMSPATLWRRATAERWERLHPGVYALPGSAATHERQISAALLAVNGKVAACRHSAAYLWRIADHAPSVVDLVVPPNRRAPALEGVHVLRSRTVTPADLRCVDGLAVTSPARTICDLAAVMHNDHELRLLVLTACRRGVLELAELRERQAALARSPGATRLARILHELDAEPLGSIFSHELRAFVRSHGLTPHPTPLWIPCRDGRVRQIDVPFIDQRVGIDVDEGNQTDEDDEKDLELAAVGWRIGRLTRRCFRQDRDRWLQSLRRLLAMPPPPVSRS
jgi:hypothetical protein